MERTPVTSSNIISIGYAPASETLEVEFQSSIYQYFNVPSAIYNELMEANSHGKYLRQEIQNHYEYKQIS